MFDCKGNKVPERWISTVNNVNKLFISLQYESKFVKITVPLCKQEIQFVENGNTFKYIKTTLIAFHTNKNVVRTKRLTLCRISHLLPMHVHGLRDEAESLADVVAAVGLEEPLEALRAHVRAAVRQQ